MRPYLDNRKLWFGLIVWIGLQTFNLYAQDVVVDTLTIRGEFKPPMENVDYLMNERPYGTFVRNLTINIPIQADKAEAKFENGLLTLVLPKAEEVRPKVIKVKAK